MPDEAPLNDDLADVLRRLNQQDQLRAGCASMARMLAGYRDELKLAGFDRRERADIVATYHRLLLTRALWPGGSGPDG